MRLNPKEKVDGIGLGLTLCKKVEERHRGSITASGIKNEKAKCTIS